MLLLANVAVTMVKVSSDYQKNNHLIDISVAIP